MEKELVIILGNEGEKNQVDLNKSAHIVVIAEHKHGKTAFLENIVEQVLKSDEEIEIYILRSHIEEQSFMFNNKYKNKYIKYIAVEDLNYVLEELIKRKRYRRKKKRVLLVIDEFTEVSNSLTEEEFKYKIDCILRLGKGMNVNLLMSSTNENIIKSANVPVMIYGKCDNKNYELKHGEFLVRLDMLYKKIIL